MYKVFIWPRHLGNSCYSEWRHWTVALNCDLNYLQKQQTKPDLEIFLWSVVLIDSVLASVVGKWRSVMMSHALPGLSEMFPLWSVMRSDPRTSINVKRLIRGLRRWWVGERCQLVTNKLWTAAYPKQSVVSYVTVTPHVHISKVVYSPCCPPTLYIIYSFLWTLL